MMIIKKHIPQESYFSWMQHFSLFVPLDALEQKLLQKSSQNFAQAFPQTRLFPDPFLNPAPRNENANLADAIIIAPEESELMQMAKRLKTLIREQYDVDVKMIADTEAIDFWNTEQPVVLIGGAQDNYWSRRLAQRLQLGVFNADFPGKSGWGITTYQGIQQGLGIRYVLVGEASLKYFLQQAIKANSMQMQWLHHVQIDPALPAEFYDFDSWLRQLPLLETINLNAIINWAHSDHQRPYREVFQKVLLAMRENSIISNWALLDTGLEAIRYYQLTGNERGLDLFREMMWGFWEYFNSEDPNIYISDMDFRLGQICAYWSWIEHHPAITNEERVKFAQLLLGAMRIAHSYYRQKWAQMEQPEGVSFNHVTFKGRCLLWGWRYFKQRQVLDAEVWKEDADAIFQHMDAARIKYKENANGYETYAPEHLLTWHEITGKEISEEFQNALAVFAWREWALTDNFCYRVEYGDCGVTFRKKKSFQVAPWLPSDNVLFDEIRTLEEYAAATFSPAIPRAFFSFGDIQGAAKNDLNNAMTGWTLIPLEPKLEAQYPLQGKKEQRFDKFVWRSGWQNNSSYLAIEGFGNEVVSHAHNAANSIIRTNAGGRIWLVGNGYGKKIGITNAAKAYSTRERGPVDHNMVILRDNENKIVIPPVNALLVDSGNIPIPFAITQLPSYGAYTWTRHTFLLGEAGFIIMDLLLPQAGETQVENVSLEWNFLGSVDKNDRGAIIDQSGVKLVFEHFDTGKIEWGYNASASWHQVMAEQQYPYTTNVVEKCVLIRPPQNSSAPQHFVSGFWLEGKVREATWNAEMKLLQIQLDQPLSNASTQYRGVWGEISVDKNLLQIKRL